MPDKSPDAFRTISEVADWLGVQPHVLRFWESKFSQVRPVKRAGGRRYYRPNDMLLLGGIRKLLHEDGLTIKGAQKVLREEGMSHVARLSQPLDAESAALSDLAAAHADSAAGAQDAPGQVLDLDAARSDPPPPQPPLDDHSDPGPEPLEDASPTASRPDTGTEDEMPAAHDASDAEHAAEPSEDPGAAADPSEADRGAPPTFMRDPSNRRPAGPEAKDTAPARPDTQAPAADRLPSFLQPPPASETPAQVEVAEVGARTLPADQPGDSAGADEPQVTEPGADAPRPRVVDVPDPDESAFAVAPGALGAAYSATSLSAERRAELAPLMSRLAALRDRMAAAQGR